jgi:molybdopterin converting factor small subunit
MFGTLREIAEVDDFLIDANNVKNVKELVQSMVNKYAGLRNILIDPVQGNLLPTSLVLIDGIEIGNLNGYDTLIPEGSEIVFLSTTHGG